MLGDAPIKFEDALAEGMATPELGTISRTVRECDILFDVPLTLHLQFTIPLLAEAYKALATVHLRLRAETYEPARLYLKASRIKEEEILFASGVAEGLGLAKTLGAQWDLFNRMVRTKIKSEINARLRASRAARLIDLSVLALERTSGELDPVPAVQPTDKINLVPTGLDVSGKLEPRMSHAYAIALGAGEQIKFVIYTASVKDGVTAHGSFELLTAQNKIIKSANTPSRPGERQRIAITTEGGWLGDYRRQEQSFQAEVAGVYYFRLRNTEHAPGHAFHYTVRQERTKPRLGLAACFGSIGP